MDFRGRKILVTGANGFVGRHVVAQCLAAGAETVAVDLGGSGRADFREVLLDLTDAEALRQLILEERPDGVLHLASAGVNHNTGTLHDLLRINVLPLEAILQSVDAAGLDCHVVIAGSGFEYRSSAAPVAENAPLGPTTGYGISKVAATMLAGSFANKVRVSVVRPFSVYGAGEREPRLFPYLISQARRGLAVELTGCRQIRDYLYVEDLANAFLHVLAHPPVKKELQLFNAGTGEAVSLAEIVVALTKALEELGLHPDLRIGARPYRDNEIMHYVADVGRIREVTGWRHRTALSDGIRKMVAAGCQ